MMCVDSTWWWFEAMLSAIPEKGSCWDPCRAVYSPGRLTPRSLTASFPLKRNPGPNREVVGSNHHVSRAMLNFWRVTAFAPTNNPLEKENHLNHPPPWLWVPWSFLCQNHAYFLLASLGTNKFLPPRKCEDHDWHLYKRDMLVPWRVTHTHGKHNLGMFNCWVEWTTQIEK